MAAVRSERAKVRGGMSAPPSWRRFLTVIAALGLTSALVAGGASAQSAQPVASVPDPPQIPSGREQADGPPPARAPSAGLANSALRVAVDRLSRGQAPNDPRVRVSQGRLQVEALGRDTAAIEAEVAALGGTVTGSVPGELVEALVPFRRLRELEASPAVRSVRPPHRSAPESVATTARSAPSFSALALIIGEEVLKTNAAAWHAAGHTGAGIEVGIIDFFNGTKWNAAVAAGELPAPAGTFCSYNGAACDVWSFGSDHGQGVAEIVHEMAPGAQLHVATARTAADFQAAMNYFATQGVAVVTRSLTSEYDGPGNGTGPIASVIDNGVASGITYFNSAGNSAGDLVRDGSYWRQTGMTDADADGWLEFAPGDELMAFGCGFMNGLRWDDWGEANRTDFDLLIYDNPVDFPMSPRAGSVSDQTAGADPVEIAGYSCTDAEDYLAINLYDAGASAVDTLEFMVNGTGLEYWSNLGSAGGPASDSASAGALSIGAVDPAVGTTIAGYSSQGPLNDGRMAPSLSAAACVLSFTYGNIGLCFNGTSAATPVAAGAAALVLGSGAASTPAQAKTYLMNATVDRGAAGPDNVYGRGELLLPAPPAGPGPTFNWAANNSTDFDGDHMTDFGLYRGLSPESLWYAPGTGGGGPFQIFFAATGDIPVPGDYNGDGKTDAVIYRPTTGLWYGPATGLPLIVIQQILGGPGDIPIPGDYDGDGTTDPAYYRPSTGLFFGVKSGGGLLNIAFGAPGDVPVPRDYDGDGTTDPAIYRADATPEHYGLWYAVLSGGGVHQIYFGAPGDVPVPGDYDGDEKADSVIYRPTTGLWYGPRTGAAQIVIQMLLGQPGDVPIPGYYNNDLVTDPAFYRPGTGLWFALLSGGGVSRIDGLGLATDVPVQKRPALAGGV